MPGRIPVGGREGYRIELASTDSLDVTDFRDQVTQATTAMKTHGDYRGAVRLLRAALGLWGYPPLPDLPDLSGVDPALHAVRENLLFRRRTALSALHTAQMELGEHHQMIEDLRTELVRQSADEADEDLHVLLMRALYLLGRRSEALRHYTEAAAAIKHATGRGPSPVLRQLYDQIADAQAATASVTNPVSARPQLPVPAQLPPDVGDFTGRAGEIEYITDLLTSRPDATAPPILSISGMGGVGKSALAKHVAYRLRPHYPDGQLFVHLAGRPGAPANAGELLAELLLSLNVSAHELPTSTPQRATMLRSLLSGRRILMVIDDAPGLNQIQPFLPGEPQCAVIVTSRAFIPGAGFKHLRLEPLAQTEALRLLGEIIGIGRVEAEPEAAHAVVTACAGLPLAVRIIGSRLAAQQHWPISMLASRLRDRLEVLDRLAEGEMTITAIITESYENLSLSAQHGLRVLALAGPGDWPMWLAEMLLGSEQAEVALGALTMHSLLAPAGVDELGHPRYQMHDLVREFAEKRLNEHVSERDMTMSRLLGGWTLLTDRAAALTCGDPSFSPPARLSARDILVPVAARELIEADADAWLAGENAQILSVIRLACSENRYQLAYGLASRIAAHLYRRGRGRDAENMWRNIMRSAEGADDIRLAAEARSRVAALIADRPDGPRRALPMLDVCVATFAQLVDWQPWARALALRALCRYRIALQLRQSAAQDASAAAPEQDASLRQALADAERGLELAELIEEPWMEVMCRRVLGAIASAQGHHEDAVTWCQSALQQSIQITRRFGDGAYEASAAIALADVLVAAGRYEQALLVCQHNQSLIERIRNAAAAAALAERAGDALVGLGNHVEALQRYEQAVALCGVDGPDPLRVRYVAKWERTHQRVRQAERRSERVSRPGSDIHHLPPGQDIPFGGSVAEKAVGSLANAEVEPGGDLGVDAFDRIAHPRVDPVAGDVEDRDVTVDGDFL
ncbi:ATP-binding protein [Streptosporangium canum]|uniref:ATP-binding protein n=1 Tax=Streptosporangium canum TaxID=324952 RepID=UPI0036979441